MISFKNFSFKYNNVVDKTLKNIDLTINKGEKVLTALLHILSAFVISVKKPYVPVSSL